MTIDREGPLTPAELEMLAWNTPILKPSGKLEPPDIEYDYMLEVMKAAKTQSGRRITSLDELNRLARKHNQAGRKSGARESGCKSPEHLSKAL